MIKLIASDLDGTLIPPTKIIPEETFSLIEKFTSLGGVFVPSSGRQLPNLKKLFTPVLDKIAIIAENGGLVWYKGEIIYSDPTPSEGVKRAIEVIRGEEGLYPVISCADCAYYEDDYPQFVETFKRSYSSYKKVDDLIAIADSVTALKISVWDTQLSAEHGGKILPPKIKGLRTMVSGRDWLDVSVAHANKGRALNALMQFLKVEKEGCVAFGDHMNDLEMLQASGKPYVTANAFPKLKECIGEEIPSNADLGVILKIKELIGE
ncbi:MAG: HAD-IIB family hydrolase [Candidatus Coproplasma sp.]